MALSPVWAISMVTVWEAPAASESATSQVSVLMPAQLAELPSSRILSITVPAGTFTVNWIAWASLNTLALRTVRVSAVVVPMPLRTEAGRVAETSTIGLSYCCEVSCSIQDR